MPDYMTLLGAQHVESAASQIRSAADVMKNAASEMQYAFQQHQRFLEDWLTSFREALEQQKGK